MELKQQNVPVQSKRKIKAQPWRSRALSQCFQRQISRLQTPRINQRILSADTRQYHGFRQQNIFLRQVQGIHTVFITQNVPEEFSHQTTAQRQSDIYETDLPSSLSYFRFKSPGVQQAKMSRSNLEQIILLQGMWQRLNIQHVKHNGFQPRIHGRV